MHTINQEQLIDLLTAGESIVLLDVRGEKDFDLSHIPHAINVPVEDEDFERVFTIKYPDRETTVIVYSDDIEETDDAIEHLEESGYENVYSYTGGFQDWKESPENPTEGKA